MRQPLEGLHFRIEIALGLLYAGRCWLGGRQEEQVGGKGCKQVKNRRWIKERSVSVVVMVIVVVVEKIIRYLLKGTTFGSGWHYRKSCTINLEKTV